MPAAENDNIRAAVRQHVVETYFTGEHGHSLGDDTPLYLDSIDFIDVVMFIEERFGIEFMSSEIDRRTFRSVAQIEKTIRNKLEQKS